MKKLWLLWARALGEKASSDASEADTIAIIRTFIVLISCIANIVLVVNVVHHW